MYRIFLYMYVQILLRCTVGLTMNLDCWFAYLPVHDSSLLVCSLPSCVFTQVSKGRTHSTFRVLKPFMHLPCLSAHVTPLLPTRTSYLPLHATAVKVIPYDPLMRLLYQAVQGLVGTSYRGYPMTCWQIQHCQHIPI